MKISVHLSQSKSIKKITREQAVNSCICPSCHSTDIKFKPTSCLCNITNHSCWTYPVCNTCCFTAGSSAGNSNGGIWIPFSKLCADKKYNIELNL
jgi:hypothetical protein